MTFEELVKVVEQHGQKLERHEFMYKSLSDLGGQIYKVVDYQNQLISDINLRINEGFSEVQQYLASHDAQLKMLQNTVRMDACRAAQRDHDIEQRMNCRFAESKLRFDALEERLDTIDERLDGHDKRFDAIDERLDGHDKRFDAHDKRFDEHDKRFDRIDNELAELKQLIIERLPK